MKKKIFVGLILIVVMIVLQGILGISNVKAETITGSEGMVSWSFDSEIGVITFSGSGKLSGNWRFNLDDSAERVKKIIVEEGITEFQDFAFQGCKNVESIDIPDSVIHIDVQAFAGCESLKSIKIPDNLTTNSSFIVNSWFDCCKNLNNIVIGENNKYLSCEDNIIFNKDKTKIIWYNPNKIDTMYIIPDGVSIIESSAFGGAHNLTEIQISRNVTTIGMGAFYDCIGLKKIIIPNNVTNIENLTIYKMEGLIIYCKSNSKIKEFAEQFDYKYILDDDVPIINVKQVENKIEITATDSGAGLDKMAYSLNGKDWQESNIFNVTESKSYTVYVRDALDNVGNKSINVNIVNNNEEDKKDENSKIDIEKPIVNVSVDGYKIKITATDNEKLAEKPYSLDKENWQSSNEIIVEKNGEYTVYVRDVAGNIASKLIVVEEKTNTNNSENGISDENKIDKNENTENKEDKTPSEDRMPSEDNTQSPDKIPQTGTVSIISVVIIMGLIAVISYKKFKKNNY